MRKLAIIVSIIAFTVLSVVAAFLIHPFCYPPSDMDDYIIENTQQETGANSAVTAVVFDYRGYDTLGEATILFTAVTGVVMLFRKLGGEKKQ